MAKLMSEIRPNAEAPTKEAVAAEAMADTENRVPMFSMHVASIREFVIFWLACTEGMGQPAFELWISVSLAGMTTLLVQSLLRVEGEMSSSVDAQQLKLALQPLQEPLLSVCPALMVWCSQESTIC